MAVGSAGPAPPPAVSAPAPDLERLALVVVDVQQGFADEAFWGRRDNPACEDNVRALLAEWRGRGRPVVLVRHDSTSPSSPLHPSSPGNAQADAEAHASKTNASELRVCMGRPAMHQQCHTSIVRLRGAQRPGATRMKLHATAPSARSRAVRAACPDRTYCNSHARTRPTTTVTPEVFTMS